MRLLTSLLLALSLACNDPHASNPTRDKPPSREEMAACATANVIEQPGVESYWAPGTFDEPTDDLARQWFSAQLCAMGEPPLTSPPPGAKRMRFLWLRTFHPGIAIRIEGSPESAHLIATELTGAGGYAPGTVGRREQRILLPEEWSETQRLLTAAGFWRLPTNKPVLGLDGAHWILEVSEPKRYHIVDRWSGDELEDIGTYLLDLSGLDPEPIY